MKEDQASYFESNDFLELLTCYENMVEGGVSHYFDGIDISNIAEFYSSMDDDDKAMDAIQFGLSLHPEDTDILITKGQVLLRQGKCEESRAVADSIEDNENRELLFLKGSIELFDGNPVLADKYFHLSVGADDHDPGLYADIIAIFTDYAQYDFAQTWLNEALALEPESKDFIEQQADLYFATQDYDKATQAYDQLIDDYPYDIYYWEQLVCIAYRQEKWAQVLDYFGYIEAIDPLFDSMNLIKAECLIETEAYTEAESVLRRTVSEKGESGEALFLLGTALSLQERHEEAISYMTKAIGLNPDDKVMNVHLAGELYECGRYSEAAANLTIAFKDGVITAADTIRALIIPLLKEDNTQVIYEMLKALMDVSDIDDNEYGLFLPALTMCCWQMGYTDDFKKYFSKAYDRDSGGILRLFGVTDTGISKDEAVSLLMRVYDNDNKNVE